MNSDREVGFYEELVTSIYVAAGKVSLSRQSLSFAVCMGEYFPENKELSLSHVLGKLSAVVVNDTVLRHFGTHALEHLCTSGVLERNVNMTVRRDDGDAVNAVVTLYPSKDKQDVLFTVKRLPSQRNSITLMLNKHAETIHFADILYVDSGNHCVDIHTLSQTTSFFSTTFSHVSEILLKNPRFLRSYKNCIVNMDKVKCIDKDMFLMSNGDFIPIPKRRFRQIKQSYEEYAALTNR